MRKGLSLFFIICLTMSLVQFPAFASDTAVPEENIVNLLAANKTSYYSQQSEIEYKYTNSNEDTIIPLPLANGPVTQNFTFETDIKMEDDNVANLKLNLYSSVDYNTAKARIIGINFAKDYMTADNDKNNMYGKTAVIPYDTGANGNEWNYIMLPGLMEKGTYKNIKIYFDFENKSYDLYIDNYLVADDNYFTNEDAADLTTAEFIAPKGVTNYKLKNTAITSGYNGMFIKPVKVYSTNNEELSKLTAGETTIARFKALKSGGTNLDFSMKACHNSQTQTINKTLIADETWQDFDYIFVPASANDNITLGGYDTLNNAVIKQNGLINNPVIKNQAKVFIIGDSTIGPYTGATGWGEVISGFTNENATIRSFGRSGTSTRTYWHSGRPDVIGYEMTEGDYLLFQLGHNDCVAAGTGTGVKNTTIDEYKAYIARYINFAREHGVHMIFVTPPSQNSVGSVNQFSLADTTTALYERVAAMKEMASLYGVPLIDLYGYTRSGFRTILDYEGSLSRIYVDGTHFTEIGAKYLAYYITNGFKILTNGAQNLVKTLETVDISVLSALISENEQKSSINYSGASFDAFSTELNNSLFELNNPIATQEEIDNQVEALKTAIDNLIEDDPASQKTVLAAKDAYTQKSSAGSNFNSDILLAKYPSTETTTTTARRSFIGFNIEDISESATQVILKLYITQLGSNATYADTVSVHTTTDNWTETALTWNNMPTTYSTSPIATFGPLNIFSTNANYADVKGFKDFDVTQYVLSEKAKGTKNISFAVAATASGSSYCIFSSKENADGNGPRLVTRATSIKTLGQKKEEDLGAINIEDYINDVSLNQITQSLNTLPTAGSVNGYEITWASSNPSILSSAGQIVSRPQNNTEVTLTASIISDGFKHTKEFKLVVFQNTQGWTDSNYINYELNNLEFTDFSTQNQNQIYTDITLPDVSEYGFCTYTWGVSDSAVAVVTNNIAKFTIKNDIEASLNLTVTAKRGTALITKNFPIKLIRGFSDNLIVENQAKISASSGKTSGLTTRDFDTYWETSIKDETNTLIFTFASETSVNSALFVERGDVIRGFTITYSNDGKDWNTAYTGTTIGDRKRNLIEFKEFSAKIVKFTVTAKNSGTVSLYTAELYDAIITDTQKIAADIKTVSIPKKATSNILLPLNGPNGSIIIWESSDTRYISDTGAVNRGTKESPVVILTAAYTNGDKKEVVTYPVTVPAELSGGGGTGGGGGSSIPYVPKTTQPPAGVEQEIAFNDVSNEFWAHEYIISLAKKGIVNSKTDTFRPNDNITREEFLKLIVLAAKIPLSGEDVKFTDIDKNEWYYSYITAAYKYGIAKGKDDGTFGIGAQITRQDMAVMAARLLEMNGRLTLENGELSYADSSEVSDYAKSAVAGLTQMGILSGNENKFMPVNSATRAEAAKIITLIYNEMNR